MSVVFFAWAINYIVVFIPSQRIGRIVSRTFENRTSDTADRIDERPLVSGRLYGYNDGYFWTRIVIHNNRHLCAVFAVLVCNDMGYGCPRSVQKQSLSVCQWRHRIEHHRREIHLSVLQV